MALRNVSKIHRIRSPVDYEMSNGQGSWSYISSSHISGKAAAELVLRANVPLYLSLSLSPRLLSSPLPL